MMPNLQERDGSLGVSMTQVRASVAELRRDLLTRKVLKSCEKIKYELAAARFQTALIAHAFICRKAGFKEDQPRWSAGTPGQPKPGGRWSGGHGTGPGRVEVTTSPGFMTGDSIIDKTSESLSKTLVQVMEDVQFIPEGSPQVYGIAVHAAFAMQVRLQNLPGIGVNNVERSFSSEDADPRYGLAGTIRTDVALQNDQGDVIAIYDLKTGERPLSLARANQLRQMTRAAPDTPVFELNVVRGITRKSLASPSDGFSFRRVRF